jgi:hypothetical protein
MLIKLNLEGRLCVRNPFYSGHRNLELKIANSADSDSRHGSEPLEHAKSPLFHSQSFSQWGRSHGVEGPILVAKDATRMGHRPKVLDALHVAPQQISHN